MPELRRSPMHTIASRIGWHPLAVLCAYVCVFGWMIFGHDGLPYVMDNNESFSAFVHARNLYEYGVERSYGLPDESLAAEASGHPYVYTHGGNFPRLPALLLYALGARTIESQIAITTLSAGLVGVLLAYLFMAAIAGRGLATTFCLLLISDYLMFAQWNVVTWRVWHGLFLFGVFLCTHRLARGRSPAAWLALPLLYAGLFYYELIFALFVTVAAATYAAFELGRRPARLLAVYAVGATGACAAAGLFAAQLIGYMGVDGFLTDLRLTFVARNETSDAVLLGQRIQEFAEANGIAYVYNFHATGDSRNLPTLFSWLVLYVLRVYTPWLALVVGLLFGAAAGARLLARVESRALGRAGSRLGAACLRGLEVLRAPAGPERAGRIVSAGVLVFAASVLADGSAIGLRSEHAALGGVSATWRTLVGAAATLVGVAWLLARLASGTPAKPPPRGPSWLRVGAAFGLAIGGAAWVRAHEALYEGAYYHPLWLEVLATARACGALEIGLIAALVHALDRLLLGPPPDASEHDALPALLRFLSCGAVALLAVHFLSPGYLQTGYLARYAPFTVFFHLVPVAFVAHTLWRSARRGASEGLAWPGVAGSLADAARHLWHATRRFAPAAAAASFTLYWVDLQLTYVRALPPDHYAFLERLREPRFRGASFVTNNYAAPVAIYADGFAYVDPTFPQARPHEAGGFERDLRYLWVADRADDPAYATPRFFVCMMWVDLRTAVINLTRDASRWAPGCSDFGLVRAASAAGGAQGRLRVLDRDRSGRDRWAIVELGPPGSATHVASGRGDGDRPPEATPPRADFPQGGDPS